MEPKTWQHKKTKKKFRVMPWWEMIESDKMFDHNELPNPQINKPWKFGMLVQVGWLLENEHGVWFGLGPKAEKHFKEVKT